MTLDRVVPLGGIRAGTNITFDDLDGTNTVRISAIADAGDITAVDAGPGISAVESPPGTVTVGNTGVISLSNGANTTAVNEGSGVWHIDATGGGGGGVNYTGITRHSSAAMGLVEGANTDGGLAIDGTYGAGIDTVCVEIQEDFTVTTPFLVNDSFTVHVAATDALSGPITVLAVEQQWQPRISGPTQPMTMADGYGTILLFDSTDVISYDGVTVWTKVWIASSALAHINFVYTITLDVPGGPGRLRRNNSPAVVSVTGFKAPDGVGPYWP